jgi:ABC-type bacteriocin/lantibiotic exporter with double-glycine peptidase domain
MFYTDWVITFLNVFIGIGVAITIVYDWRLFPVATISIFLFVMYVWKWSDTIYDKMRRNIEGK